MDANRIPAPTPEQAVHVLEILERWAERTWDYEVSTFSRHAGVAVTYTNPEDVFDTLTSYGTNHFDAICQATTAMQILLEEYPGESFMLTPEQARLLQLALRPEPQSSLEQNDYSVFRGTDEDAQWMELERMGYATGFRDSVSVRTWRVTDAGRAALLASGLKPPAGP